MVEKGIRDGISHAIHLYAKANNNYMKDFVITFWISTCKFNDKGYSDKGHLTGTDIKFTKKLHKLHSNQLFLLKIIKIDKCEKLVCNLFDKKSYAIHINALKQALNHGCKFRKVQRVIEFDQEAWFRLCIYKHETESKSQK